ncbi:MAG: Triostin synthetase I [Syntrophorhabdaceae bacterium PtaU1.Bin034]|nr:MAG: Triostin synthetase I [Syntrophorhabdaceae bacterium PtaU1.Bin034]
MNDQTIQRRRDDAAKYEKYRWWMGLTLGDVLDRTADVFPQKEGLVDDKVRLTFGELRDRVNRLAIGLLDLGIAKGDYILLQLPNWGEYVYSYFALQKIGAIPVVLISGYGSLEVSHLCKLTGAKAWIVPEIYRKTDYTTFIGKVREENGNLEHVISVRAKAVKEPFTASIEGLMDRSLNAADLARLEAARPEPTDIAHVVPSGGTTGMPKGIPRTHNDYICNVQYLHQGWEMGIGDAALVIVPVGHNLAVLNVVGAMLFGFKLVLLDSTRPADICASIQKEKVTFMPTVPSLMRRIVQMPELGQYDLASLKKISAGGEPSTPDLIREVYAKLKCVYINEFGMTEGVLCRTSLTDDVDTICTTVGKICCPYDVAKIVDENGNEVPVGIDGELVAKGPGIFEGYLNNPEETAKSFTKDGYFRTGDQARMDGRGYLTITGRIKDLIIRGGENISPGQVEELLCSCEGIADAAVIGMPDKELGEKVCAYVRLVPGATFDAEAIKNLMESKGASKLLIPERFEVRDVLPFTEAGKHDKKALRKDIKQILGIA